jgi:hypothetical protein
VLETDTLMDSPEAQARLARATLDLAATL